MHLNRRTILQLMATVPALAAMSKDGLAQTYPDKSIRLVIPFPPGGGTDAIIRPMIPKMTELLGQQPVVENIGGSGAIIGADVVAKAAPDGYTILAGTIASHGISPSLYPDVSYDPVADFSPITFIGAAPYVLAVNPKVEATTIQELIALAKANPGKLNFASAGSGSATHLTMERLKLATGIDITHIPYKGAAAGITDLLADRVQMAYNPVGLYQSHFDAKTLRPLAVAGAARLPSIPDVPTLEEAGVKNADGGGWYGLLAPAKTPDEIVAKLNQATNDTLKDPTVIKQLQAAGVAPVGGTPDQFASFIKSEIAAWKEVIRVSGAKVE